MMNTRRVPFNNSLPLNKAAWVDAYCKKHGITHTSIFEHAVDELMAKEDATGKSNGHDTKQARARV